MGEVLQIVNANGLPFHRRPDGLYATGYGTSTKHDYNLDYGWKDQLGFMDFYRQYTRNALATAAVEKTIAKTWQTMPALWESEKPADTPDEAAIAERFRDRNIWRSLMTADKRSMVGAYAAAIVIVRDGLPLDQPVGRLSSIDDLVSVIPAWEGQVEVADWDTDPRSETYAEPKMFRFQEFEPQRQHGRPNRFTNIHPSRVIIWSDDGTVNCRSDLEPGFNDLVDSEKLKGAGAEGFWKSSRGSPMVTAPQGVSAQDVRQMMGAATNTEAMDKVNEQVDAWNAGFDKALMMGGFNVEPLTITLPQPKEFWEVSVQAFAASMSIPFKILVGNITGERSSTEDAREWAQTCMSRRENMCIPAIREFVRRLVEWGALPEKDWVVGWESLLDATPDELLDRGVKMATIQKGLTELIYLPDEIRETTGFAPSDEIEGWDEYVAEQEEKAAQALEDAQASMVEESPEQ